MWVTNKSGYDIVLAGVLLHKNSQQQLTTAEATALNNNAIFTAMITEGVSLIASENQPEANPQMYVRATDSVPTLNGIPSNPKGYPAVSPSETFEIGKEEGDADLEDNKEVSITENGEIEITPTEGKDGMKKVTANVAVPVPVLEANKATTIDVSTYTEPIEVTPTSGKDAMEKNTITLNNIPSGGSATAYAWKATYDEGGVQKTYYYYTTFAKAPADKDAWENEKILYVDVDTNLSYIGAMQVVTGFQIAGADPSDTDYQKDSDTQFTVLWDIGDTTVFTRDATKDVTLWI